MKNVILHYLKPYYSRMAVGFLIKFFGTIMDLCLPWALAHVIDVVIPLEDKPQIYFWGMVMLICSALAVITNIIANRMASKVARDATEHIRFDLFRKVMNLSNQQVDAFTKPSLISRLTTDTYNLNQMIGRIQRLGVRAPILLIGGIVVTLSLDPVLAGILLLALPLLVTVLVLVSRKSIPMFTSLQEAVDHFVRLVREDIGGIRMIKALSKGDYERRRFDKVNQEVVDREKRASMTTAVINPVMNVILNLGLVAVIVAGAYRVNSNLTQVGKILAFMTYFTVILNAMLSISKMFVIFSKAIASAERIGKVLDGETEQVFSDLEEKKESPYLVFDHVSFSYNKVENNLEDICFCLNKGETLGIIGETGAGKTTISSLLMRFYDSDSGDIYLEGKNIKTIDPGILRERFGVVFQNDTLFEDSILENVRLGRNLSEEVLMEALLYARAKEFVEEKDGKGYGKLDIKGANLSGGQKQRILIARALAAHPDILILDDSSSALDYKTDAALRKEIKDHFAETTQIIIAQRISSIMHAAHILVLEDGKMIGFGSHDQLMKGCPVYQEISHSQMGG